MQQQLQEAELQRQIEKEEQENAAKEADERAREVSEQAEQAAAELRSEMIRSAVRAKNNFYFGGLLLLIVGGVIYIIKSTNRRESMNANQKYGVIVMLSSFLLILLVLMISDGWRPELDFLENLMNTLRVQLIEFKTEHPIDPYVYLDLGYSYSYLINMPSKYIALILLSTGAYGFTTYLRITPAIRPWEKATSVRTLPLNEENVSAAELFCELTINSPDENYFKSLLSVMPSSMTATEKARLRVCLSVAHAGVFLWYFDHMENIFGPDLPLSYIKELRSELAKNAVEVYVEDHVFTTEELAHFSAKCADRFVIAAKDSGRRRIQLSELIECLISIREDSIRAAVQVDMDKTADGFHFPFMNTSRLVVLHFTGQDPSELLYGEVLAAMIGQELGAIITSVNKVLMVGSRSSDLSSA